MILLVVLVLTGSTADISEMKDRTFGYAYKREGGTQRCLVAREVE
jgi:hypothetical protein